MEHVHTIHLRAPILPLLQHSVHSTVFLPNLSSLFIYLIYDNLDVFDPNSVLDVSFTHFPHLRQLVVVPDRRSAPIYLDEGEASNYVDFFSEAIEASSSVIVHLDLLYHLFPFERMAGLSLTSLRSLVLRGQISPQTPTSLITFIATVPQLSDLVVDLLVNDGRHGSHFSVFPDNPPMTPIPELRRLTLANPHPLDCIFQNLPTDMQFLSLPSLPPQRNILDGSWYRELALSSSAAFRTLEKCTASRLVEFRISILGLLKPELLTLIAQTFPVLERFELRYRESFSATESILDVGEHKSPVRFLLVT